MNRFNTIAGAAAVCLLAVGCVDRSAQKQAENTQKIVNNPTRVVAVEPARTQTLEESMEITGDVTTSEETQVGPKQTGRLVAVYVKDGDTVSAGQLIATQDVTALNAQLRSALAGLSAARSQLSQARSNAVVAPSRTTAAIQSAQAQLRSARAQLKKAQAGARPEERTQVEWQVRSAKSNLDTAQKELDRIQKLVEQGAVARQQLDTAQNAYQSALTAYNAALQNQLMIQRGNRAEDISVAQEAVRQAEEGLRTAQANKKLDVLLNDQVQGAQAAVQSAQAQVDIARQAIADAQIRAPFSGKIDGRPMQPGTIAAPGSTVARIIGSGGVYFEGQVPETALSRIKIGSPVQVTLSAVPGRIFAGTVAAISPQGQDIGRLFSIRVQLAGSLAEIRPGMFATGKVRVRSIPSATVVPANAVVQRQGKSVVFLADGQKAKQVPVEVGLQQNDVSQVSGLHVGDRVIVKGQEALEDGSPIQVQQAGSSALIPSSTLGS